MDIKLTVTTIRNITVVKKEIYFRGGIGTIKLKEYTRDLSVTIKFDTERVGFGGGELVYFAPKGGMSKDEQREYIYNKLQTHKMEIEEALNSYYFKKKGR